MAFIHLGGSYSLEFWFAMIVGFVTPVFILRNAIKQKHFTLIRTAALMALIGLYFDKDVWLKIPQVIPLS